MGPFPLFHQTAQIIGSQEDHRQFYQFGRLEGERTQDQPALGPFEGFPIAIHKEQEPNQKHTDPLDIREDLVVIPFPSDSVHQH